jgi:hypothetical protein
MTMTVKFDPSLEQRLRQRSAALGKPAGEIVREALQGWLANSPEPVQGAHALGADLFGRHHGPAGMATQRKKQGPGIWAAKHRARG